MGGNMRKDCCRSSIIARRGEDPLPLIPHEFFPLSSRCRVSNALPSGTEKAVRRTPPLPLFRFDFMPSIAGRRDMILAFIHGALVDESRWCVRHDFSTEVNVDGRSVYLDLWDTIPHEVRPLFGTARLFIFK
jgi:hypothetical protein